MKTWSCKIGEVDPNLVPEGGDAPMRKAVEKAYKKLTGKEADFTFSGWWAQLDELERADVEDRAPADWFWKHYYKRAAVEQMYEAFRDILEETEKADSNGTWNLHTENIAEIAQSMIDEASPPQPTKEN